MSQIYISDEALRQYLQYAGNDASSKKLMRGFRKGRKTNIHHDKKHIRTRRHQTDTIANPVARQKIKTFLRRTKKSLKTSKAQKVCTPNTLLNNAKPCEEKRASRTIPAQPIVFAHAPQLSKRTTELHKKEQALIRTKGNDVYNFAGEYNARNVEFGHGRRKSLEWDQKSAAELRKEIERLNKLHKSDPNLFDREAIK